MSQRKKFRNPADMALLRTAGLRGHNFVGIYTDHQGERRLLCEGHTVNICWEMMSGCKERTVYMKGEHRWYIVEED